MDESPFWLLVMRMLEECPGALVLGILLTGFAVGMFMHGLRVLAHMLLC